MAKIITINRKYLTFTVSVVLIALIGFVGISLWKTTHTTTTKTEVAPEIKMLGVTIEPAAITKDVTYDKVTLKNVQIIPAKTFDLVATVQNTTDKKMTDIPVELVLTLVDDTTRKDTAVGSIPSLEPGGSARIAFRQINALGDAEGKSPTKGQHLITLRINTNEAGGVTQATQALFKFNVDSSVKPIK